MGMEVLSAAKYPLLCKYQSGSDAGPVGREDGIDGRDRKVCYELKEGGKKTASGPVVGVFLEVCALSGNPGM